MAQRSPSGQHKIGVPNHAHVANAVVNDQWRVRRNSRLHQEIVAAIRSHRIPRPLDGGDIYLWRYEGEEFKTSFFATKTWHHLRSKKSSGHWAKLVWFSQGIPQCAFITRVAIKNRLSTGDRTKAWGQIQPCVICGELNESRDHLFFACPYSCTVWMEVSKPLLRHRITPDWNDTLCRMLTTRFDAASFILVCPAFQVSVEKLRKERNDRRHNRGSYTATQLARIIDRQVRDRLHVVCYQDYTRLQYIMQQWLHGR